MLTLGTYFNMRCPHESLFKIQIYMCIFWNIYMKLYILAGRQRWENERERDWQRYGGNRFISKMSGITFHSRLIFNQGVFILLVYYRFYFSKWGFLLKGEKELLRHIYLHTVLKKIFLKVGWFIKLQYIHLITSI